MTRAKKARPFSASGLPPYLQAFVLITGRGQVILARVVAEDRAAGLSAARMGAESLFDCGGIWDSAAYPCGDTERAAGPGFDMLKDCPAFPRVVYLEGHLFQNPESDLAIDGHFPPFYIFDSELQGHLAGPFETRQAGHDWAASQGLKLTEEESGNAA